MICDFCQREVNEGSAFCTHCGAPMNSDVAIAKEKECLDNFYRFFKYERLAWKIPGIVMAVFCAIIGFISLIFLLAGLKEPAAIGGAFVSLLYLALFLPIAIVNLKMVSKAEYYMDTLYNDVAPMRKRAQSVGMIVLAAFFNEIALIFIIINFVRAKTTKETLNRIELRQQSFKGPQL